MNQDSIVYDDIKASIKYSSFLSDNGVDEIHAIIQLSALNDSFECQLHRIKEASDRFLNENDIKDFKPILKRYFLSDAVNQSYMIGDDGDCALSFIQQPPLNGTKVGLWICAMKNVKVSKENETLIVEHNGYMHLWNLGMMCKEGDSYSQTYKLLENYQNSLGRYDANIADNCVRTWFFVRDVDIQYMPMVVARREFFEKIGLTKDTHFIASTGICGVPDSPKSIIQMGAYAVKGLEEGQQEYIHALSHLNPTHEYGVTFERGTKVMYGDREHIIISGTASINNKGEVVHEGEVEKQTMRMWENVEALLKDAQASFDDVMQIIVYLRDTADYNVVKEMFEKKFPNTPYIITLAPVCRPKWLIEMECVALKKAKHPQFRDF